MFKHMCVYCGDDFESDDRYEEYCCDACEQEDQEQFDYDDVWFENNDEEGNG